MNESKSPMDDNGSSAFRLSGRDANGGEMCMVVRNEESLDRFSYNGLVIKNICSDSASCARLTITPFQSSSVLMRCAACNRSPKQAYPSECQRLSWKFIIFMVWNG